ncbi:hypothetical protein QQ045_004215 [Rhodiola kirilowii]
MKSVEDSIAVCVYLAMPKSFYGDVDSVSMERHLMRPPMELDITESKETRQISGELMRRLDSWQRRCLQLVIQS